MPSTIRQPSAGESRRLRDPSGRYATKTSPDVRFEAHILAAEGLSIRHIARRLDLHPSTIASILREPFDPVLARALRDPEVLELASAEPAEEKPSPA